MKKILSLFIVLLAQNLCAQSILRLQHINVEDGLSQSSVNHIFQDKDGFIWFATGDGLNKYDGKQIVVYKGSFNDSIPATLKDRNINSRIFEDNRQRLWFTSDAGVYYMDKRHLKFNVVIDKYQTQCAAVIIAIDSHFLWAAVTRFGIFQIDLSSLHVKHYPFSDTFQNDHKIMSAIERGAGTEDGLWIADNVGVLFFDKKLHTDKRIMINENICGLHKLQDGRLLLGTKGGIYLYNVKEKTALFVPVRSPEPGKTAMWKACAEDTARHRVYLSAVTGGDICMLDLLTRKYEWLRFQNNNINDLYIDHSANLWVGTEGAGVYKLDIKPPKFFCYAPERSPAAGGQNSFMVKSIYRDDSGKIWMGVYNKGLIVYDPATGHEEQVPVAGSYDGQLISSIIKDSLGNIVVSVSNTVVWVDPVTHRVIRQVELPFYPRVSAASPIVYALVEWKKGSYLAGTQVGTYVVSYESGQAFLSTPFSGDSLVSGWPYNYYKSSDGYLYIGRRTGFSKVRMISDTAYEFADRAFGDVPVRHFYKTRNYPVLWVATEQGLIAYNETSKRYKVFDETAGLANGFIYAILAQNDSSLWVSTNHGIANVRVRYGNVDDIQVKVVNYTARDGLQSDEFNTGAYYQDKDGTMMFGGIAGINWFRPADIKTNPNKAVPTIAAIYVNDSLFAGDTATYIQALDFPYGRNTISLLLRALEFTQPAENQFAYKLEGMDKDWVYTASDKVRYSNLSPGTYTFLLKVSNNEGIWNDDPLKIQIIIHPPYWQTWWFRFLVGLFLGVVIYLMARYYVKQKIKAKTRELEKKQALYMERLRISKDVHDDLGSGLSKISLIADIAQKRVDGNAALGNEIRHISTVSRELVENMRDLIWVLNPENTTLDQLVARLREYCADYLDNIPIEAKLDFPLEIPAMRISREVQRNIFLTAKEAINNCVKHAGASEINITVSLRSAMLNIVISDNGKGFDTAHLKGSGNGLRNMRQRIEVVGGSFSMASAAGTTISISVPFKNLSVDTTFV